MLLKVNVIVDMVPVVDCAPVNTLAAFSGSLHSRVGTAMRYSSTLAVHVMVCWSPAVRTGTAEIVTVGAWRAEI